MEPIVIVTGLCICLSLLQAPCASMQIVPEQLLSLDQEVSNDSDQFSLPMVLPRKLRLLEEASTVKGNRDHEAPASSNKQKTDMSADKPYHNKQNVMQGNKGTWQEWKEGSDASQFFTMDYSHVKRRRPIHNKSLPVGP